MTRIWQADYTTTEAASSRQLPFGAAAVATDRVVGIAAAPALIAWTGATEHIWDINNGEISAASVVAAGGETAVTLTHNGPRVAAGWLEERDDLGGLDGTPVGSHGFATGGAITIGTVTTTGEFSRLYAAVLILDPPSQPALTWGAGLTTQDALLSVDAANEDVWLVVASATVAAGEHSVTVSGLPTDALTQGLALAFEIGESDVPGRSAYTTAGAPGAGHQTASASGSAYGSATAARARGGVV